MKKYFKALNIRLISTVAAVLLALPLSWKEITGFYAWLSPFIFLNSVFLLKAVVWMNIAGSMVLTFTIFRKRWFCRYLCPVGYGCDLVSKKSKRKQFSLRKIPAIGKWIAIISLTASLAGIPLFILLDPISLFNGFFSAFSGTSSIAVYISLIGFPLLLISQLFFPHIWCGKICPLGGLQDEITMLKLSIKGFLTKEAKRRAQKHDGRRIFIASGLGALAGLSLPKIMRPISASYIRPPAAQPPFVFNTLCIRCGSCIKACPTDILIHHRSADNLTAWMTPEVSFQNKGYCIENCNLCAKVCPSGAINLFSIAAKKQLVMASAVIHLDKCLLTSNKECDRCKAACKYDAIKILPGLSGLQMQPFLVTNKCVGCGACAVICPTKVIEMLAPNTQSLHA